MLLEFAISPLGEGESLSEEVAQVLDLVDRSGLPYEADRDQRRECRQSGYS